MLLRRMEGSRRPAGGPPGRGGATTEVFTPAPTADPSGRTGKVMVTEPREVDRIVGEFLRGGYSDYVVALRVIDYMTAEHRAEVVEALRPKAGRISRCIAEHLPRLIRSEYDEAAAV